MNKKEACTLAYNLIVGLKDIDDDEFVDVLIDAIKNGEEYIVEEMLEVEEIEY